MERERLEEEARIAQEARAGQRCGGDEEGGLPAHALQSYEPGRVILTGPAGTGKSRTVRAIVASRRRRAVAKGLSEDDALRTSVLAAPTGCASFQMKYGATTVHRAFGIQPSQYCGPTVNRQSEYFLARVRRLRAARLYVLDEFSMIGRQQLGRVEFRLRDALPSAQREFGREVMLAGRDAMMAGDERQMKPIGDESLFKEGPYTGKGETGRGGRRAARW